MQTIKVIGRGFAVGPGDVMRLSKVQAGDRAHALDEIRGRKGHYTARQVLEFKVGEQLGVDLEQIAKSHRVLVEPVEGDQPV